MDGLRRHGGGRASRGHPAVQGVPGHGRDALRHVRRHRQVARALAQAVRACCCRTAADQSSLLLLRAACCCSEHLPQSCSSTLCTLRCRTAECTLAHALDNLDGSSFRLTLLGLPTLCGVASDVTNTPDGDGAACNQPSKAAEQVSLSSVLS